MLKNVLIMVKRYFIGVFFYIEITIYTILAEMGNFNLYQ